MCWLINRFHTCYPGATVGCQVSGKVQKWNNCAQPCIAVQSLLVGENSDDFSKYLLLCFRVFLPGLLRNTTTLIVIAVPDVPKAI